MTTYVFEYNAIPNDGLVKTEDDIKVQIKAINRCQAERKIWKMSKSGFSFTLTRTYKIDEATGEYIELDPHKNDEYYKNIEIDVI